MPPLSMPPRRSCFARLAHIGLGGVLSFNATTAFLLPLEAGGGHVVGHDVSMPPRRSCFGPAHQPRCAVEFGFQCHHGFPASFLTLCPMFLSPSSFNATTAFLLRSAAGVRVGPSALFQCHHGVPALTVVRRVWCVWDVVSMPPRRSCFRDPRGRARGGAGSFNATTAFLLPGRTSRPSAFLFGFNATTAFLLRAKPKEAGNDPRGFQCHHGVPASGNAAETRGAVRDVSMPPRRSCFVPIVEGVKIQVQRFQCHHGVPASAAGSPASRCG